MFTKFAKELSSIPTHLSLLDASKILDEINVDKETSTLFIQALDLHGDMSQTLKTITNLSSKDDTPPELKVQAKKLFDEIILCKQTIAAIIEKVSTIIPDKATIAKNQLDDLPMSIAQEIELKSKMEIKPSGEDIAAISFDIIYEMHDIITGLLYSLYEASGKDLKDLFKEERKEIIPETLSNPPPPPSFEGTLNYFSKFFK